MLKSSLRFTDALFQLGQRTCGHLLGTDYGWLQLSTSALCYPSLPVFAVIRDFRARLALAGVELHPQKVGLALPVPHMSL